MSCLHVKYVEQRTNYGVLFIWSVFGEYMNLEYVRIRVVCRIQQASVAARYLEKKTRRFFDFFCAPPFLFPRVHPRLT